MRFSNVPFNCWFVHTPPGGHIDGTSGDCDLNKPRKVEVLKRTPMVKVPHSPQNVVFYYD